MGEIEASAAPSPPGATSPWHEAVSPLLQAVTLGRTDITKTLLEEVRGRMEKEANDPQETRKNSSRRPHKMFLE